MLRLAFTVAVLFCLVLFAGCGANDPKGPTYGEALQTYETELELLDRLEKESHDAFNAELAVIEEERKHEPVQLALEKLGEPDTGTVESRSADRAKRKSGHKAKHDEVQQQIKVQRIKVEAAKKVVDELSKTK